VGSSSLSGRGGPHSFRADTADVGDKTDTLLVKLAKIYVPAHASVSREGVPYKKKGYWREAPRTMAELQPAERQAIAESRSIMTRGPGPPPKGLPQESPGEKAAYKAVRSNVEKLEKKAAGKWDPKKPWAKYSVDDKDIAYVEKDDEGRILGYVQTGRGLPNALVVSGTGVSSVSKTGGYRDVAMARSALKAALKRRGLSTERASSKTRLGRAMVDATRAERRGGS
jgi:hypothetical protein